MPGEGRPGAATGSGSRMGLEAVFLPPHQRPGQELTRAQAYCLQRPKTSGSRLGPSGAVPLEPLEVLLKALVPAARGLLKAEGPGAEGCQGQGSRAEPRRSPKSSRAGHSLGSPGPAGPSGLILLTAPSSREAGRPPEEPSAPSPALPAQFKQRAPMYNSGLSPATPTPAAPTSPLTPTTPPAVAPAAQAPPVATVAPQTQPPAQQQPKKNLSLTVGMPWRGCGPPGGRWGLASRAGSTRTGGGRLGPGPHAPRPAPCRGSRCSLPRRCSRQPTKSRGPRRPSSWASWLALEVRPCCWPGGGRGPGWGGGQAPWPQVPAQQHPPSTENPCQEQGDVIQIKLSEHTEDLPKSDGQGSTTMLVDTVFEMNYATGQWTRFKKYKPMANVS